MSFATVRAVHKGKGCLPRSQLLAGLPCHLWKKFWWLSQASPCAVVGFQCAWSLHEVTKLTEIYSSDFALNVRINSHALNEDTCFKDGRQSIICVNNRSAKTSTPPHSSTRDPPKQPIGHLSDEQLDACINSNQLSQVPFCINSLMTIIFSSRYVSSMQNK